MMRISLSIVRCVKIRSAPRSLSIIANPNPPKQICKKIEELCYAREWEEFKKKFNKSYATAEEEFKRRQLFIESYNWVAEHNKQYGDHSGKVVLNNLADWTPEEKKKMCGRVIDTNMLFSSPAHSSKREVDEKVVGCFNKEWEDFKKRFNKSYATKEEEIQRRQLFIETYHRVAERNKRNGEVSTRVLVNNLADWTPEEKKRLCGFRHSPTDV